MLISDKHFAGFKELYKKEFGEEEYNKKTEQQLLESATKLLRLIEIVYKHQIMDNYEKEEKTA